MSNQNGKCSDKHQYWSENVRCPTAISSTVKAPASIQESDPVKTFTECKSVN